MTFFSQNDFNVLGLSATDLSKVFNISLIVAKEQLNLAEKKEFICRDESVQGVFYFPNLFKEFVLKTEFKTL